MPRNIEIKARIASVEALMPVVRALADGDAELIEQDDSFFAVPAGRFKLRVFADGRGELIHYHRPDEAGPKTSLYRIVPAPDPEALRAQLAESNGLIGRVRKRRWLLMCGATRIHLDRVDGLGDFLELEVVLRDGQPEAEGEAIAQRLMQQLGVQPADLLRGAYLDLLQPAATS